MPGLPAPAPGARYRAARRQYFAYQEAVKADPRHWLCGAAELASRFRAAFLALKEGRLQDLEAALGEIAGADDWTRRYARQLAEMSPTVRKAFGALVKRGWVPYRLLDYLQGIERGKDSNDIVRVTRLYRHRLESLRSKFLSLANACDRYKALAQSSPDAWKWQGDVFFPVRRDLAPYLRNEAERFGGFLRETDPRRGRSGMTKSVHSVLQIMEETLELSGSYSDRHVVALISQSSLGFRNPGSADALRRWRLRQQAKWAHWQLPDWRKSDAFPKLIGTPKELLSVADAIRAQSTAT